MSVEANQPELFMITVSSRIPEFWTDQPALWFTQFEAAVAPQKSSDDSKYQLVIAKLGKAVIQQVADVLSTPPDTKRYDTLKARLLSIYEESENRRVQTLLSEMHLGDQKPSQLLRRMQGLAGERLNDSTLSILWQNHLPTSVRTVLAVADIKDVFKLAAVADKVMETTKTPDVASVSTSSTLEDTVAKLSIEVAEMKRVAFRQSQQRHGRSRSRFRGRHTGSRANSTSRRRTPKDEDWLCFYHFRFKNKANKCVDPCNWKGNKPGK